ncbi:MAG: ATP-binding cassette domain-containing protein [Clostridia bacterium]|nr:ATP-binding cassette domain-containing protein [Clostridia bacterium]
MLEIRGLTRIYKDKGGAETLALDNVSLSFGETGLVFILGKSGCGKSTFLNCVGGLDTPTSGEITVNGRNFSDFTAKDLDAYRNTFVGFVFQEYNVLPEFTVEDNVALALELQSEKDTKDKVAEILREVDLAEYAQRKPGTLSGGQKQRIAIARALVKDPRIIMADEPTGALDSGTGRQVLETLRSLSSTRLVIVVSHDRDFAESFADRIIELKDGRVISDITRITQEAKPLGSGDNVRLIGENTLSIKAGAGLTQEDFSEIRSFISSGKSVIITKGEAEIDSFRTANRISGDSYESFIQTPSSAPAEEPLEELSKADTSSRLPAAEPAEKPGKGKSQESGFISSRLPFGKAVKMGVTSIKGHPVRLVFTIILSIVAFVVFGLFSCVMTYDKDTVAAKSFMAGDDTYFTVQKRSLITRQTTNTGSGGTYYSYTYDYTGFGEADAELFGADEQDVLLGCSCSPTIYNASLSSEASRLSYYSLSTYKALVVPEGNALRNDITGRYPETAGEVCISGYTAEALLNSTLEYSVYDEGTGAVSYITKTFETEEELIGETLETSIGDLTITGIIDTGKVPSKYDYMKTEEASYEDSRKLSRYLSNGIDESLFVTDEFVEEYTSDSDSGYIYTADYFNDMSSSFVLAWDVGNADITEPADAAWNENIYYISPYSSSGANNLPVHMSGEDRDLEGDEIILLLDYVQDIAETQAEGLTLADNAEQYAAYYGTYDENLSFIPGAQAAMEGLISGYYSYMAASYDTDESVIWSSAMAPVPEDEQGEFIEIIEEYLADYPINISLFRYESSSTSCMQSLSVAGFMLGSETHIRSYTNVMYCSEEVFGTLGNYSHTDYVESSADYPDSPYTFMVVPLKMDMSWLKSFMSRLYNTDNAIYYTASNYMYSSVSSVTDVIDTLSIIFLVVGLVFAVFSALLLFNFITVSITGRNREIGILRALGAKGTDVFKIFFSESALVAIICFVLSVIITACLAVYINSLLASMFYIYVSAVVFGTASIFMMLAITVVVAFLGTFFPVYCASKKKPVESIRSL